MIVDSSALIALLHLEHGFENLLDALLRSKQNPQIASPNFLETAIVVDGKRDPALARKFEDAIEEFRIQVVPFTAEHAKLAREAYRDFGKGSGHPAKLNFGDCMAYALARAQRKPLLYVGGDFAHTGIEAA